ncbi:MAG: hypothetical protein IJX77_10280 [Ruminococcus sp.]|nr:hypothetical protein [Ruminococcus sp.]
MANKNNWDAMTAPYRRTPVENIVPVYGIKNTYNGKLLDVQFDSVTEARNYIKQRGYSQYLRPTVIGKRGIE